MRRLLSLVLAAVMLASVAVIAVGAVTADTAETGAQKATVTVTGFNNESSDTKTYAVGETFTVYTALNVSAISEDGINVIDGAQYYDGGALQLASPLKDDGISFADPASVFPVIKKEMMGNGGLPNEVRYNATIPNMNDGFKFLSDDSMLIVTQYTVLAHLNKNPKLFE